MALLRNLTSEKKEVLKAYHLIGRHEEKCDLIVHANDCSRVHAAIEFKNNEWRITDFSSYGTLLNNRGSIGYWYATQ